MKTTLGFSGVLLPLSLILLAGCGDGDGRPASADLFPLAEGNIWNYGGGQADTITAREIIDGNAYYQFGAGSPFGLVRLNDSDQLVRIIPCCGDAILFDFDATVGDSWIFDDCADHLPILITLLSAQEEIEVPAGRFTGCYRFAAFGSEYVVCPGIGIVAVEDSQGGLSRELVSYRLKPQEPEPISPGTNLVVNGSFERLCCPSFQGWSVINPQLSSSAAESPENGGCWSLRLTADWAPTTAILRQRIDGVADGEVLRLSGYIRAEDPNGGGSIALLVGNSPWAAAGKRAWVADAQWTLRTIVDTLSITPGDSVWVELAAFPTEIVPRTGLFDSVVLERVTPNPVVRP